MKQQHQTSKPFSRKKAQKGNAFFFAPFAPLRG